MRARRRLPGVLALGVAGVMALCGVVGTGSAMAAEGHEEQCAGAEIGGQGSSLQKAAQEIWGENIVTGKGFNLSTNGSACSGTQGSGGKPVIKKYEATGSGAGRTIWGAEATGHFAWDTSGDNPAESKDAFIGSDEPLSPTQMENIDLASNAAGGKGQTLVIPVEQAAVAVIVNPPEGCEIKAITNKNLQEIWDTKITEWSGVTGGKSEGAGVTEKTSGVSCKVGIIRVVREDVSGTTFVFKSYLDEIEKGELCSGKTWETYASTTENLKWPEPGEENKAKTEKCGGAKVRVAKPKGGAAEAEEVEKTADSIGYANLADARKAYTDETGDHYHWLGIQNQRAAKDFPEPGTSASEPSLTSGESNCKGTDYPNRPTEVGADDNWSKVSGAHPGSGTAQNANYPICTLTYDVALMNYFTAQFYKLASGKEEEEANKSGKTAYDYLNYVVAPGGGQADLAGHDYLEVEEAVGKYAQEEALLIAEGSDIQFETKESSKELSFDTGEDLFLWIIPGEEPFPLTVINKGGLPIDPAAIFSWLDETGKFTISNNECETLTELTVGKSCKLDVDPTEAGLWYFMFLDYDILNVVFL